MVASAIIGSKSLWFQTVCQKQDYFKRSFSAPNLHKKIEYMASIAPAQLGKAKISGYKKPAATG